MPQGADQVVQPIRMKVEMSQSNGKTDIRLEERATEMQEPELPAADPNDGFVEKESSAPAAQNAAQAADPPVAAAAPELEKLKAERENLTDRLARLQAEFDNYRKRSQRENADFRDYAVADAARTLLPVIDSFSLALRNAGANPEDFRKGVELIHKQLQDVLQKMNVQRVPAQGQPFDPRVHEAVQRDEEGEGEKEVVTAVYQKGYKLGDKVIRAAVVKIGRQ